jgi:flagellar biosynthetic protein FlhB
MKSLMIVAPLFLVAMLVGVITHVVQVGWHPTMKPLTPKFSKLNPASGFKRIFSFRALVELAKSLLKFGIIGYVILTTLQKESHMIYAVIDMGLLEAVGYVAGVAMDMGIAVGAWYVAIAIADFIYIRLKHNKDLMMTKQEVKEEYKSIEGNPQIKGQIRQRMREASMRRMMQDVPKADVIITNPTHFAIALKYDKDSGQAPKVIAKGADHMARRIKEKAIEHNVTIVENKPLARTLYATVDIGKEIPPELYQSVAEILAYVYKLKNIA